ncbi:TIGR00289 family protein [archaeon SCG-AAA382B04]|nr:TIGR00289 family protein [archaeon SCG-AAA382B04]
MKIASLFTGGKDSTYSLYKAMEEGYTPSVLVSMIPKKEGSYLYHSKNIKLTSLMSKSLDIDIFKSPSESEKNKEAEELKEALEKAQNKYEFDTLGVGAIQSKYQKTRVESISKELGLNLYSPLWNVDIEEYMRNLIKEGFESIITSVSAEGLDESFLGKKIDEEMLERLIDIKQKHKINLAGEGGEYETTVLDAPIFDKKIKIEDSELTYDENKMRGEYRIKKASLSQNGV